MRRLAAIMFTDMVGYSALTQKNEALALELLAEHRTILRPFFDKHDGREIETAGDSFFVEFNSAVEATNCAIEIQQALHQRNLNESSERSITIRIGIHIGDVVYMDQHVHGDGVNIAARLEPKAPPGGICISEDVARQIRNKIEFPVIKLGEEKLKNISMPMEIYCIQLPWVTSHAKKHVRPKRKLGVVAAVFAVIAIAAVAFFVLNNQTAHATPSTKNRLAILPLKNISNNAQDEYFSDGLTEELISSISKIGGLNVIARTSTMKYKNTTKDIGQISKELMVNAVLEGSVRKIDNKARITVQLIDATNQENLWTMDYDRELSDIFSIQSEIATSIAKELKIRLVQSEKDQLEKNLTENISAYQDYLLGKHNLNLRTPESIQLALSYFEKAIEGDPHFSLPYTQLAYCYTLIGVAGYGSIPREVAESKAKESVMRALDIDSTLAEAHAALAYIKFRIDWDWKGAESEFKRAIALKPGYSTAHEWYGLFLGTQVRGDEALEQMQIAYNLDPLSPSVNTGLSRIYHFRHEDKKALEQALKTVEMDPDYAEGHFTLGMSYYVNKEYERAEHELQTAIDMARRRPVMLGMMARTKIKLGKIDDAKKMLGELQQGPVNNDKLYAIAVVQDALGMTDESYRIFNKLAEEKYGIMVYMKAEQDMFKDPKDGRYEQLIKKLGF